MLEVFWKQRSLDPIRMCQQQFAQSLGATEDGGKNTCLFRGDPFHEADSRSCFEQFRKVLGALRVRRSLNCLWPNQILHPSIKSHFSRACNAPPLIIPLTFAAEGTTPACPQGDCGHAPVRQCRQRSVVVDWGTSELV